MADLTLPQVCTHEAGHAVVATVLGLTCPRVAVDADAVKREAWESPDLEDGGGVRLGATHLFPKQLKRRPIPGALTLLAGGCAEHVFHGEKLARGISTGDRAMIRDDCGIPWSSARLLVPSALALVVAHRDAIALVAEALRRETTLSAERLRELIHEED